MRVWYTYFFRIRSERREATRILDVPRSGEMQDVGEMNCKARTLNDATVNGWRVRRTIERAAQPSLDRDGTRTRPHKYQQKDGTDELAAVPQCPCSKEEYDWVPYQYFVISGVGK